MKIVIGKWRERFLVRVYNAEGGGGRRVLVRENHRLISLPSRNVNRCVRRYRAMAGADLSYLPQMCLHIVFR